ncbi:Protein of unknown function [Pedococcus dokdonensis]|uniref:DUF2505 domain-containing protein n=1 Tax=Pedococcus dokdonensis TaxID=443156 RepID=A0A1H0R5L6_9MICO|nr:DUF2505 domain-containing protein [Pedococcus dokdonensis]SDP24822.1 Protein of unknown function [Pedococcus dokdonensis]
MKIAKSIEYPGTPDAVFAVLSDVAFQEAKCAATAAIKHSANVETVGDHTVITTERVLPSDGLPDFAKSMVGDTLKVTETQDWGPASASGGRRGTVEMAVAGAPISLKGTLMLAPGPGCTVETLDAELKAKVPLIGGKIEKAAAPPIEEAIDIEAQTARTWLNR